MGSMAFNFTMLIQNERGGIMATFLSLSELQSTPHLYTSLFRNSPLHDLSYELSNEIINSADFCKVRFNNVARKFWKKMPQKNQW